MSLTNTVDDFFPATAPNCGPYTLTITDADPAGDPNALLEFITLLDANGDPGTPSVTGPATIRFHPTLNQVPGGAIPLLLVASLDEYPAAQK
jgi:hypothetical protein